MSRKERLRQEASAWIARLNGMHDHEDRAAFERWYRADPENASTYDRLSVLFGVANRLRPAQGAGVVGSAWSRAAAAWPKRQAVAALAAAGGILILVYLLLGGVQIIPASRSGGQVAVFATTNDASRMVTLLDGSQILLSPGSELEVDIDGERRQLRLTRGEGRFTVFHERRPFVVIAPGAEVTARGTQFLVRVAPDGTLVSLIEGSVEVSYAAPASRSDRNVIRLTPGQQLVVPVVSASRPSSETLAAGPYQTAMIEFVDDRLAEAVDMVNRRSDLRIHLADPALGDLRLTGAFDAGDSEGFARSVGAAFGLEVKRTGDGALWLGKRHHS